jgi:hypothetical protein
MTLAVMATIAMSFFIAFLLDCVDLHLFEVRSTWLHNENGLTASPHH